MRKNASPVRFEIEYGGFRETHRASTPHDAWLKFIDGKQVIVGTIAQFRERPWNSKYAWEIKCETRKRGCWYYVNPSWFLSAEANRAVQSDLFVHGDLKN